jgi:predicted alpha/beta-fold hydrolase
MPYVREHMAHLKNQAAMANKDHRSSVDPAEKQRQQQEALKRLEKEKALKAKTIREFDDAITRISFDWPSVDEYYAKSSSSLSVPDIRVPTLVIQADDDPIAPIHATPCQHLEANENCILVVTPTGGHLGWCSGDNGIFDAPWTDMALMQYFGAVQMLLDERKEPRMQQDEIKGVYTEKTVEETV